MTPSSVPRLLDRAEVRRSLPHPRSADALDAVLRSGFDPATAAARTILPFTGGFFGLMPAELPASAVGAVLGAKLVTVVPGNRQAGLPTLNGHVVLFDRGTGIPIAFVDADAITELRTPAVSMIAYRFMRARLPAPERVVVFGAGPQGIGHLDALAAETAVGSATVHTTIVVRNPERAALPERCSAAEVLALGSREIADRLRRADLVVCATSASEPLFDSSPLRDQCAVIAIGSHRPDARELDSALIGRASVIVEERAAALREAGDIVMAIEEGRTTADRLWTVRDLYDDPGVLGNGPFVFKSVGMAWEDVAVAAASLAAADGRTTG